ncbi:MAG: LemA family protein [Actinobacteria bacterium]|nr:LemA family protein [Actinomycetota bacterium]
MVLVLIVLAIVAVLVIGVIWQFNKLRRFMVNVDEGYAQIEVQLTRRADLIPNLVETVKGYATHEKAVLEAVTNARAAVTNADSVSQTAAADGALTSAINGVMIVAENYPDLKASANFLQLQEELTTTENKVAFARQYYNESVRALNTALVTVPSMFFAGVAHASKREFYEVPDESQRLAPDVGFS